MADMVIDNSKNLKHLQNEVERIIEEIIWHIQNIVQVEMTL
jgi:dephospho-CoA kinase